MIQLPIFMLRRVKPLCLCSRVQKSPWGVSVDKKQIESSNIFNQALSLCGCRWRTVLMRDGWAASHERHHSDFHPQTAAAALLPAPCWRSKVIPLLDLCFVPKSSLSSHRPTHHRTAAEGAVGKARSSPARGEPGQPLHAVAGRAAGRAPQTPLTQVQPGWHRQTPLCAGTD